VNIWENSENRNNSVWLKYKKKEHSYAEKWRDKAVQSLAFTHSDELARAFRLNRVLKTFWKIVSCKRDKFVFKRSARWPDGQTLLKSTFEFSVSVEDPFSDSNRAQLKESDGRRGPIIVNSEDTMMCLFTPRKPIVTRGDSFWGRVALKLVVTKIVFVKLLYGDLRLRRK